MVGDFLTSKEKNKIVSNVINLIKKKKNLQKQKFERNEVDLFSRAVQSDDSRYVIGRFTKIIQTLRERKDKNGAKIIYRTMY